MGASKVESALYNNHNNGKSLNGNQLGPKKPIKNKVLSASEQREMVVLLNQGYLLSSVAFRFGISSRHAREILKHTSPDLLKERRCFKKNVLNDRQARIAARLYQEGYTIEDITKRYGADDATVRNAINRFCPGLLRSGQTLANLEPESQAVERAKNILRKRISPVYCLGRVFIGDALDKYRVGHDIVSREELLEMANGAD